MRAPIAPDAPATRIDVPLKVLVVDDSPLIHEVMKEKLGRLGERYRLHTAHARSGEEALRHFQAGAYDIVFLDVEMPGLNGHEACRRIKAQHRGTRVAMLSSLARPCDRDAAFGAGCDHYLEKPPKDTVLDAVLRVSGLRKQLYQP